MIKHGDATYLASHGITDLALSDFYPWPALDFIHDETPYTLIYGLHTDVYVLHDRQADTMLGFKYASDLTAMHASIWTEQGVPLPFHRHAAMYLAAIIRADVASIGGRYAHPSITRVN